MKLRVFLCMALIALQACATNTVQLPKTGQTAGNSGADHSAKRAWSPLSGPRFKDNNNGTVTDNSTGLIWLKDANCADTADNITKPGGRLTWANALTWTKALASGVCGLSDGSTTGQWRLPKDVELKSLVNLGDHDNAVLMNAVGFTNVQESCYWSFNTNSLLKGNAHLPFDWYVFMFPSFKNNCETDGSYYVWPVRSGQEMR